MFGFGRKGVGYDLKNARHVVLQTRNIFEAINVQEVNDLMEAMENGCKLTVIDIRVNVSATKADRFLMIRPGSDYALNLAVIQRLLNHNLYDAAYANKWFKDLDVLEQFVKPYTPNGPRKKPAYRPRKSCAVRRELSPRTPRRSSGIPGG